MKKIVVLGVVLVVAGIILSCTNDYITGGGGEKEVNRPSARSVSTGGFDLTPYYDVSNEANDCNMINNDIFSEYIGREYQNGYSVLRFDVVKKEVTLHISDCKLKGYENSNIYLNYEYELKAASRNLGYIVPKRGTQINCIVNGKRVEADEVSPFMFYIPFYGFGNSRFEVSAHFAGESLINSGTYWVKK